MRGIVSLANKTAIDVPPRRGIPPRVRFRARGAPLFGLAGLAVSWLAGCGSAPRISAGTRARALGFAEVGRTTTGARVWAREAAVDKLTLLEVVVGTDEVDRPLPLVVLLHGYGDVPRVPGGPYTAIDRPYRFVAPRGPLRVEGGRAWSSVRVRDERPDALAAELGARAAALAGLVETVVRARPTTGPRVLLGYSQGGHTALALAMLQPDLFDWVVPMAAWLPPSLEPTSAPGRGPRIRGLHARGDSFVPYEPTEALYRRLRELGWDATLESIEGGHQSGPEVDAFVQRQLEHAFGSD